MNDAPQRETQTARQLEEISKKLDALQETIGRFGARLGEVTRDSTPAKTQETQEREELVPIASSIRTCVSRIDCCREVLEDIYDRLEV